VQGKKCPQSFRTAGKSTKSGGDTGFEALVTSAVEMEQLSALSRAGAHLMSNVEAQ
jgi:hypothetical protein